MIVGELLPTHKMGFVLCFRGGGGGGGGGISTMLYPILFMTLGGMDS